MNSFGTAAAECNRVVLGVLMLLAVMIAGTAGYLIIEDYSLLDSAYMAAKTITTVGYSEVRPLSETGKVFTIGLFLGVGTAFYILTALVAAIIEGDLRQPFGARRMKLMIERLHGHYIVCGFAALQPLVTDFIDILPSADQGNRILAEITVADDSEVAGRQIGDVLATGENMCSLLCATSAAG